MTTHQQGPTRRQFLVAGGGLLGAWGAAIVAMGATIAPGPRPPTVVRDPRLPPFVTTASANASYLAALERPDLLRGLPCFCGCGTYLPPHRTLLDCFIRPDGSGFDAHAAGCQVCQQETLDAARWTDEGLPPADVRRRVVATYGERGPSTDDTA